MKKTLLVLLIGLLSVISVACGNTEDKAEDEKGQAEDNEVITVSHELGETDVDKNPEKVVVFDFGALDTLDALDIDVVGVPQKTIPAYLEKYESDEYENLGSLKEPDFEKIAEIDPDLIIISSRQADLYDELSKLGPTVYLGIDTTRYMDSFEENLTTIGQIFDREDDVSDELDKVEQSISTLNEKAEAEDINALIILANDDKISAYGPNSRFGIIHDVFGVPAVDDDIEVSTHGKNVSFEYVTEKDPDYLYVIDRGAAIGEGSSAKQVVENKLMEKTKSYKNDNIVYLDPEFWYLSGGGLVSVTKMIEEIDSSLDE